MPDALAAFLPTMQKHWRSQYSIDPYHGHAPTFSSTTADWKVLLLLSCILTYFILDLWEYKWLMFVCCTAVHVGKVVGGWTEDGEVWWKPLPRRASLRRSACYCSRFLVLWGRIFFTCSALPSTVNFTCSNVFRNSSENIDFSSFLVIFYLCDRICAQ